MSATAKHDGSGKAVPVDMPKQPLTINDPESPDFVPSDNYVTRTVENTKWLPPITPKTLFWNIQWISFLALTIPPSMWMWAIWNVPAQRATIIWAVIWYFMTGLGITAGYHRLYAHRSYNASPALQYILLCWGAGAVQGSVKWWSRGHRAHHRYTDTKLDPYSAHEGFFWSHIGWMLVKPRGKIGVADISDLSKNPCVRWQHNNYLTLLVSMSLGVPTLVAGLGWGDWMGGLFYAGAARLVFVHHSTFCVNSLAHWLGETPFDNKHTPKDHFITALVTVGEGYHNFHHQFPMDFRNAIKWYQYDPTKWFIWTMYKVGLASHLKKFPDNEIRKGQYTMKLQQLAEFGEEIEWPKHSNDLPVISWEDFQTESKTRALVAIHGFIHDVSSFIDDHPGGANLVKRTIGTDATVAFFGGVYDHSNAAHNLLAMMRVGVLDGGMEVESLKLQRSASSESLVSSASDGASSASSVSVQSLYSEVEAIENRRPAYQPVAQVSNPWTLAVPPSERLLVIKQKPELRPGLMERLSSTAASPSLTRTQSFEAEA